MFNIKTFTQKIHIFQIHFTPLLPCQTSWHTSTTIPSPVTAAAPICPPLAQVQPMVAVDCYKIVPTQAHILVRVLVLVIHLATLASQLPEITWIYYGIPPSTLGR